jgi:hypothetical protein
MTDIWRLKIVFGGYLADIELHLQWVKSVNHDGKSTKKMFLTAPSLFVPRSTPPSSFLVPQSPCPQIPDSNHFKGFQPLEGFTSDSI